MLTNNQVESLSNIDPNAIPSEVLNSSQPLILKGLVSHWNLVKSGLESKHTALDYLSGYYSGQPINAFLGMPKNKGRLFYNDTMDGFNFKPVRGNFTDILTELFCHQQRNSALAIDDKTPTCYMGSTIIDRWFPNLKTENDLALTKYNPIASIWVGNQSKVSAHYDVPNNIACCAVGRRLFTLFPPNQLDNLYVGPIDFTPAGQAISLVDFDNPDFEKYPKFHTAIEHAQVAEMEAGDALFIPSMWWHHVESLSDFNVLVNFWWRTTPDYLGSPFSVLQQSILALRDLPLEQRKAWQHLLDYYVFNAESSDLSHIPAESQGILSTLDQQLANKLRKDIVENMISNITDKP